LTPGEVVFMNVRTGGFLIISMSVSLALVGCRQNQGPAPSAEGPVIPISHPVQRQVTDYYFFTGRTDAPNSVGIRARVTGHLTKVPPREGTEVKANELLFVIDPRPYKAQLEQALSQVNLYQAQLRLAKATLARDEAINASGGAGAVSRQQLDQDRAAVDQADAQVKAAQAAVESYKLNVEFTQVRSPISGRTSRNFLTVGNLVIQDQTLLTTVVSLDPMFAYFDIDEPTVIMVRRAINAGQIPLPQPGADIPVDLGLQGEEGYTHTGTVDFVNNVVNPSTGTIAVRGVFQNPLPTNGTRLLSPGMFVRIRLPIGKPHNALLVIDRAIGSDQGLKFVYVVDAQNKIQYRRVTTGPLQDDGLRVIQDGLKPDDWVVVGGLQQVRPRMEVQTEQIDMPTVPAGQFPGPGAGRPQPPPGK
jgi:multidrug efflux system membrane fusion protein